MSVLPADAPRAGGESARCTARGVSPAHPSYVKAMIEPPVAPDEPKPSPTESGDRDGASRFLARALALAAGCAVAGGVCLLFDVPVAQWCKTSPLPRELKRLLDLAEIFAHSTGVVTLLVALAALDPARAWSWRTPPPREVTAGIGGRAPFLRMIGATFTGGLVTDLLKATITRVRPRATDLAMAGSALDTFDRAAIAIPHPGHGDLMSFPSGHAAVAAGFATMLAWRYPHGTIVFAAFAILAGAQRVFSSAHYPSDVLLGAALGTAGAAIVLGRLGAPRASWREPQGVS